MPANATATLPQTASAPQAPAGARPGTVALDAALRRRRLIVFTREPGQLAEPDAMVAFPTWEAFVASGEPPLGFLLAGVRTADRDELALAIRRSRYWDRLAFEAAGAAPPSPLLDGIATPADALQACDRAEALKRSLGLDPQSLHFEEQLLYFLYLRGDAELVPVCDRQARLLYRYPVAEALAGEGIDAPQWLAALVQRRLLEPATLLDRTRHCRACGSAHLHFLDVCPHCSSLHIRRVGSLHCFTCGNVAPETAFRTETGLACPRCHVQLRHIGVDYDKPLTQFACSHCHQPFAEASVVARCLDCATVTEPGALDVREVSTLRLSAHGRAALRAGQVGESFAALESVNYVVPNYFRQLVDWALTAQARHPQLEFGLVLVHFDRATELVESLGAARAYLMLDEFARRLHELLRASDVTTRTREDHLWLFLPFANIPGFVARLDALLERQRSAGGPALSARIRGVQAPAEVQAGERCEALMTRLHAEAEAAARAPRH